MKKLKEFLITQAFFPKLKQIRKKLNVIDKFWPDISWYFFLNAFFLTKLKKLARLTYLPLVLLFVFLGFISELFNPMQIKQDYFYLFTFYIISPLFFIMQGVVLTMLMSKSVQENFHWA